MPRTVSASTPDLESGVPGVDGGRAWSIVGAGFVSMFAVFGVAYSFGPFFEPMADEFGASTGATSAVFSITAFVYFLLGSVSGLAADRFGPRRVLLVGAGAMGSGLFLTSRVDSLAVGYATYGIGVGVGVACGYVPMVATVTGWFDRRRATAVGVAVSGIGLGTLTAAPLAATLVDRDGGRAADVTFGVATTVILVVAAIIVAPAPTHTAALDVVSLRAAMTTGTFRTLYLATFLLSLCLFVPFVLLTPFAEQRGIGEVAAASLVAVIGGLNGPFELAVDEAAQELWVRVPVSSGDIRRLVSEAPAEVSSLAVDEGARPIVGRPVAGPPTAAPLAGTVDRYFALDASSASFAPGERVLVWLALAETEAASAIPFSSVFYDPTGTAWIYVVEGERAYRRARVDVLRRDGEQAVLARGPDLGTGVVSVGAAELYGAEFEPGH